MHKNTQIPLHVNNHGVILKLEPERNLIRVIRISFRANRLKINLIQGRMDGGVTGA